MHRQPARSALTCAAALPGPREAGNCTSPARCRPSEPARLDRPAPPTVDSQAQAGLDAPPTVDSDSLSESRARRRVPHLTVRLCSHLRRRSLRSARLQPPDAAGTAHVHALAARAPRCRGLVAGCPVSLTPWVCGGPGGRGRLHPRCAAAAASLRLARRQNPIAGQISRRAGRQGGAAGRQGQGGTAREARQGRHMWVSAKQGS